MVNVCRAHGFGSIVRRFPLTSNDRHRYFILALLSRHKRTRVRDSGTRFNPYRKRPTTRIII